MKKNKKAKAQKKILMLLITLASTVGVLGTSTYAWFTANKVVSVSEIQVNVAAQGGIQVSADGTSWKSIVNVADLTGADATYTTSVNQIPANLEPVSTGGVMDTNGMMEMFYGTVAANVGGDYILTTTKQTETRMNAAGRFVAFDLFFRMDATAQLRLSTNSGVTTPDAIDSGIKNSTRVAFAVLGTTPIGSSLAAIQALNAGVAAPVYIWEPNYNSHTAAAITHANDTYGLTITDGGAAVPYSGVKAIINAGQDMLLADTNATDNPASFNAMTPTYQTVTGFAAPLPIFTLNQGVSKVRIYMWVEGQDVDTENQASGGAIDFNLQFAID